MGGIWLLLRACTKIPKTAAMYPNEPRGEHLSLKCMQVPGNNFAAKFSLWNFDLSRSESLRTLEIPESSISRTLDDGSPSPASSFLKHVVSTIVSSLFFKITVLYDFRDARSWNSNPPPFLEVHRVRGSRLVLFKRSGLCWGVPGVDIGSDSCKKGCSFFL
jgi:hypothetical protein